MNILLLHNPTAGDDRPSERELVELLRNARHDVSCVATDDPQLAHRMVEKVDLLLIAGGDGTVATVLEKVGPRRSASCRWAPPTTWRGRSASRARSRR